MKKKVVYTDFAADLKDIAHLEKVNVKWKEFNKDGTLPAFFTFELKKRVDFVLYESDLTPEEKSGAVGQLISLQAFFNNGQDVAEGAIKEARKVPKVKEPNPLKDFDFKNLVMKTL